MTDRVCLTADERGACRRRWHDESPALGAFRSPLLLRPGQRIRYTMGSRPVIAALVISSASGLALVMPQDPHVGAGAPTAIPAPLPAATDDETTATYARPSPRVRLDEVSATAECTGSGMVAWRATGSGTVTVTSDGSSRSGDGFAYLMTTTSGAPVTATATAASDVRLSGAAVGECQDP